MRTLPRRPAPASLEEALESILSRGLKNQTVTHVQTLPARAAQVMEWPAQVPERLVAAYRKHGVQQPYTHQAEAMEHAMSGRHVVTVTPTASGKTLCYNVPVLSAILENESARALYLFPTKALSQDQLAELQQVIDAVGAPVKTFTYDGDTPDDARRAIRAQGHIIVTNPDMLHTGVLPHHARWARLFENLRYVVIDELHTYRGVFGSHLCNVLRRLRRICAFYGSHPTFSCRRPPSPTRTSWRRRCSRTRSAW
ncbi:MAG: DEAD/DEAH box helicase [Candidatus Xenobia bacterium]